MELFDFFSDNLIADEFSAELAEGIAYVAGNDDELRPVMVIILFFCFKN